MESSFTVPIIDLTCFGRSDDESSKEQLRVAKDLREACSRVGFFYISGHGCSAEIITDNFEAMKQFFDLDSSHKLNLDAKKSPLYRGYNSIQTGAHSCTPEDKGALPDLKESFTIGAENVTDKNPSSPMHGPNQWPSPDILPNFEEAVRRYWDAILRVVAPKLMKALAMSLDLENDLFFLNQCDNPVAQMVMLRYPPAPSDERRGCGTHTDCGFLTILAQDDVEGLEVQRRTDGTWMSAPPVEGTFIVNLGDMAARWTNDLYQSTPHRVRAPTSQTRHSIPFFLNCNFDTRVECLPGCGEPKYPPTEAGKYILEKLGLMHMLVESDVQT